MGRYGFLIFGTVFGFLLSRAGATTYDYYAGLFLFRDFQLMWVIAAGAAVGAVGLSILERRGIRTLAGGELLELRRKPWKKGLVLGSLILGVGWGLAGACPGTALAMFGEGKLGTGFTILGIFAGTYLYGATRERDPA